MKATFVTFFLLWVSISSFSQDMLGTSLGNYSGVNGIQLNPSIMNSSKTYLDINILSGDVFLENNYLYLSKKDYNFQDFFKPGYEFPQHEEQYGTDSRTFYWYDNHNAKNAFQNLKINGPGAMLLRNRHAFAITTAVRSVLTIKDMPYDIANFAYLGLNYEPQHNINYKENHPFRASQMTWAEIGLSYSYDIYQRNYKKLAVGISVKRLFGYSAAYGYVTHMDYLVPNDSSIIINNMKAEIGYSLPVDYGTEPAMYDGSLIKGKGFGFDIGLTYTKLRRLHQASYFTTYCAQPYEPYDYRLGIALIDFGAIRFKEHAEKGEINDKGAYWENVSSFEFQGLKQLIDTISYKFLGNDTAIYTGTDFYMWLPTSLSLQFDYHLQKNWFVNASFIYGVPMAHASLIHPAVLSITPRFESHAVEVSMPVSLYDWYLPRVGLSVRLWWLTLGTEKLGQFFNFRNFTGMDFYFGMKFFFDKGNCRSARIKGCADHAYQSDPK